MNSLNKLILSIFFKEKINQKLNRSQYGKFAGWSSIIINTLLFVAKLLTGLMINSLALIADSIHSISDTATSIIVIIGFKISEKPPDAEHPYGHQRAEYIATLIIAVILIVAGLEFIKEGFIRILNPEEMLFSYSILFLIISTILIKFWMGNLTSYIGKLINSASIKADAIHHYTDVISTFFVLISVIAGNFGLYFFDGIGSVLVGIMLIVTGFSIANEAADLIMGKAPSKKLISKIKNLAKSIEDVIDVHDIIIHQYGNMKFISLHLEVDSQLNANKCHEIGKSTELFLKDEIGGHYTIHVDPVETNNPLYNKLFNLIDKQISSHKYFTNFHDLKINKNNNTVFFDLVLKQSFKDDYEKNLALENIHSVLIKEFPSLLFHIHIDPFYMNN